jgi:hypothetical protein
MTRSFDVFDRDDFRSPDDPDRGASGGSESFWSLRVRLSELHRKEERADVRGREDRDRPSKNVHRFIAKSAFGRFWRSGIAVFLETATRRLNSEIRRFISFRR